MDIISLVHSQVVAAVQTKDDYEKAKSVDCDIVFLLKGDLMSIVDDVRELQDDYNKKVFIHIDLIEGLSNSKAALKYIHQMVKPVGIISTKPNIIKYAKEFNLMTIQRVFLYDTNALEKAKSMANACQPDALEIMPGVLTAILDDLTRTMRFPIFVGGLINSPAEVHEALRLGALAVSTSNHNIWKLHL